MNVAAWARMYTHVCARPTLHIGTVHIAVIACWRFARLVLYGQCVRSLHTITIGRVVLVLCSGRAVVRVVVGMTGRMQCGRVRRRHG